MTEEIKTDQNVGKNIYIIGYTTRNQIFCPTFNQQKGTKTKRIKTAKITSETKKLYN